MNPGHRRNGNWVEAFSVHVARGDLQGIELELIQPVGASFFLDALSTSGDTTQLLSFTVDDVHAVHAMLSGNAVQAVGDVRQGSHGAIVFFNPAELDLIYAELCQA